MTPDEEGWKRRLLLLIHAGPKEEVPWSQALDYLRRTLRADYVALVLRQAVPEAPALTVNASADGVKAWRGGYSYYQVYKRDPFSGLPGDHVVSVDEVLSGDVWEQSEFYQRYIRPLNVRYVLGADIATDDGVECRLRISRSAESGEFGEFERHVCDELLPHLKVAIDIHARLDAQQTEINTYVEAMERLMVGVVILDEHGEVMHRNSIADDIFDEGDGLRLVTGTLSASFSSERHEIRHLIGEALKRGVSAERPEDKVVAVTRPSGRTNLGVLVHAIPMSTWSQGKKRPAVAIFLRDPERLVSSSRETTERLFGLTTAEARLANHLANGRTLDEAAEILNIKRNTARAQLRSIFSKTGVTRQAMLVRMLLNSVATMREQEEVLPDPDDEPADD